MDFGLFCSINLAYPEVVDGIHNLVVHQELTTSTVHFMVRVAYAEI